MAGDIDLFGNEIASEPAVPQRRSRPVTNDMDLIEKVLKAASDDGYVLVGVQERVYRIDGKHGGIAEIAAVPSTEANAVHQLIDRKLLTVGGFHEYRYRNNREGPGRAVLVPTGTRRTTTRWRALSRPASWDASRKGA